VIAVAASNQDDQITRNSNWGPDTVELTAPGVDIFTIGNDGEFCLFKDTSAAAPLVSGAAALLLSACPGLESEEVRDYLNNSAVDNASTLRQRFVEFGRVNVHSAIEKCQQDNKVFKIDGTRNLIPRISILNLDLGVR
jgi:subtilisin family serine protease